MLGPLRRLSARIEAPGVRPVVLGGLVLVLLLASAAAFAVSERLKLERSPVAAPEITRAIGPLCACDRATGTLSVRLRERAVVTASVVDADGSPVRVLADSERTRRGRVTYEWDGRDDAGAIVPDGRYRLRLELEDRDRTITVPTTIRVDTKPPRIRLLEAGPTTISPSTADEGPHQIRFVYRGSEAGYARAEVDGELVVRGRVYPAGRGRLRWRGRIAGAPGDWGEYAVRLVLVDVAGNRSEPTREIPVVLRYTTPPR